MGYLDIVVPSPEENTYMALNKELNNKILNLTELSATEKPTTFDLFSLKNGWSLNNYSGYNYIDLGNLFYAWRLSDVCMTIGSALIRKVFKGGLDIKPLLELSSEGQLKKWKTFCRTPNSQGDTYLEVLKQIEDDLNWADIGIMLNVRNYLLNSSKEIIGSHLKEVIRVNPIFFNELKDKKGRLGYLENGKVAYVNINNRRKLEDSAINKETGIPNIVAHYSVNGSDGVYYYNKTEFVIKNKFKRGGFSPLFSLYNKIISLIEMDYYIRKEYSEGKPSKKMLAFKTPNREIMEEALEEYKLNVKENPNGIHPLNIQVSDMSKTGNVAEVIDFMKPLNEMEFTETRQLFMTQIGAPYGVSPMFMNDMSTGGGLNNEGLQITVTNEAVEGDKDLINNNYISNTMEELGITDYEIKLFPSEEEDQVWKEDLFSKQLDNALKYSQMGGEVKYVKGEMVYKECDLSAPVNNFNEELNGFEETEKSYLLEKPFAGFENFQSCLLEQRKHGHNMESAQKICGFLQNRSENKNMCSELEQEMSNRGMKY